VFSAAQDRDLDHLIFRTPELSDAVMVNINVTRRMIIPCLIAQRTVSARNLTLAQVTTTASMRAGDS
jgi:hypothetical protein